MTNSERSGEGRLEKLARIYTKKSLLFLGGAAVGAVLLPPAGAAAAVTLAAGSGIEAILSNMVHTHQKQKRLRNQR